MRQPKLPPTLLKKTEARVYLLHVVNLFEYGGEDEISKQLFVMKLVRKRMQEMVNAPFFQNVNVVEVLQFDMIYENIAKQANKHEIDLIVMGTHGTGGFKEFLFGSNTQKIIRLSNCPVLSVKKVPSSFDFQNIVFVSNFDSEVETAFLAVKRFADKYNATIHMVRVCTPFDFEGSLKCYELMTELANSTGTKNYTMNVYNNHSLEGGIREFGKTVKADLTAIATHGRDGLGHVLMGSRTEELVNHETMPILSVKMSE